MRQPRTGRAGSRSACSTFHRPSWPSLAGALWRPPGPGLGRGAPEPGCRRGLWLLTAAVLLQTLCLKTQGHPERYKAASRAFKAISKVSGSARPHVPPPPDGRDPGGRARGFQTVPLRLLLMGKLRPRGGGAHTQGRTGTATRADPMGIHLGWPGAGAAMHGWGGPGHSPWQPLSCAHALQLVKQCNEGAHKMERTEQIYTLHTQLDFSKVKVGGPCPGLSRPALSEVRAQPQVCRLERPRWVGGGTCPGSLAPSGPRPERSSHWRALLMNRPLFGARTIALSLPWSSPREAPSPCSQRQGSGLVCGQVSLLSPGLGTHRLSAPPPSPSL